MYKSTVVALLLSTSHAAKWAEGMEGDEDMGETITMRGKSYSYMQKKIAKFVQLDEMDDATT